MNTSAEAKMAQLVGTQSGEVVVPTFNWTCVFAGRLRKLKHIKRYHHFIISATALGCVSVRLESDSAEDMVALLIDSMWNPSPNDLPPAVVPSSLSLKRQ